MAETPVPDPNASAKAWAAEQERVAKMTWRERGAHDYGQGRLRQDAPLPAGTPEGDEWHAGWEDALAAALMAQDEADSKPEVAGDLEFSLVDSKGRVIGAGRLFNFLLKKPTT